MICARAPAPGLEHLVFAGGRRLGFREIGCTTGFPVLSFHGGLSCSSEMLFAEQICRDLGVRLIAVDRPGIGGSDLLPGRRLLDWPDDVAALADGLDLGPFAVFGWSAGGPYALACGFALPDRVTRVGCAAGMAPLDGPGGVAELGLWADRLLFPLCRRTPRLGGLLLATTRLRSARSIWKSLLASLAATGDPDRELLASVSVEAIAGPLLESLASGGFGTAWDYRLLGSPWGFDLGEVRAETLVWQGAEDGLVPRSHAERLARELPRARLAILPGHGHFLPRRALPRLLSELRAPAGRAG